MSAVSFVLNKESMIEKSGVETEKMEELNDQGSKENGGWRKEEKVGNSCRKEAGGGDVLCGV